MLFDNPNSIILDSCAGGDSLHEMSYPSAIKKKYGRDIKTIDLRKDSLAEIKADYLKFELDYQPDIIISNPPFKYAMEFIKKALNDVKDDGYVVMLLRLNFFGSKNRFNFFQTTMPEWCFVHHKRMSFLDDGKTDSIEYCHMVWHKKKDVIGDSGSSYTKLIVI